MLTNQQTGPAGSNSKLADFLRTRPLTFAATNEPLEAEDWLRDTEKKLYLARCSGADKVDRHPSTERSRLRLVENYLAARGDERPESEEEEEAEVPEAAASATGEPLAPVAAATA